MDWFLRNYLRIALSASFAGSAAWVLFVLAAAGPEADPTLRVAASLGVVICFIAPFLLVLFISGVLAGWRDLEGEEGALEINVLLTPDQRERFGFALMAAGLLLLVGMATGGERGLILSLGATALVIGGIVLVFADQTPLVEG